MVKLQCDVHHAVEYTSIKLITFSIEQYGILESEPV